MNPALKTLHCVRSYFFGDLFLRWLRMRSSGANRRDAAVGNAGFVQASMATTGYFFVGAPKTGPASNCP